MLKTKAIELLGGTVTAAAKAVGITPAAVTQWPDELPGRIVDRVIATMARQGRAIPAELLNAEEAKAA